ncbi:Cytochrome c-type biogenesis protein DsbD, protein-disulfide reductase [hydrothermal vent metagenome]|uniref:Cytochrome c-type biogenesis protein DsbD, protein-disulfide reductase n=1 Tax=hydrothermal vent metagenome TaxID=652676 RepID=A0A1W1B9Q9_9ZZZZ
MRLKLFLLFLIPLTLFAGFGRFVSPKEAFKPSVKVQDGVIVASVKLAKDIYIYDHALKFDLKSDALKIKKIIKPKAMDHDGDKVYEGEPQFRILLDNSSKANGVQKVAFTFGFQGCSAMGLCYEPMSQTYTLNIDTTKLEETKQVATSSTQSQNSVDSIADTLKHGSIWLIIATFFGFGLLLALTPCVFPMIPIISGLIVSQGKDITTKKAFFLSLIYVLAMAVAYTIAGVLAGLFGSNLQAALQNPYVVVSFALVFVALAMSMFGFYELKLPDSFVAKVSTKGQGRGGVVGVAIMGFLSALIVGPCVAAPLAGALVYIGQTGDAVLGGVALFAMSLGMGLPLIIVGTGAGKLMPRPGVWMTLVNAIFGILMLGVAIWMLEKIISPYTSMLLWALLGLGSAIYLGAFDKESHIFKRTIAIALLVYSLALGIGALAGSKSMSKPLGFLSEVKTSASPSKMTTQELKFQKIETLGQLDILLQKYRGKKIMIDFAAQWCTACKELDEKTFSDPKVQRALSDYILIRADVTKNEKQQKELSKAYGVFGPPVVIFIDKNGNIQKNKTIVGFVEPEKFLDHIL